MSTTVDQLEALQERIRQAPAVLIATRIKRARKGCEEVKTLDLLAAAISSSRQHLIKLEKGQHRPGAALLSKIAEATGRQVEWFLDPELEPSPFPDEGV